MCNSLQYARWDYVGGGVTWGSTYPTCNADHQSPINFLQPYTKYGTSYEIFKAEEDALQSNFYKLESTTLDQQLRNNRVKISIDQKDKNALNGFESKLGNKAFNAPLKWKTSIISFKHQSEHTVEGKRYDLELQVFHERNDADSTGTGAAQERNLQEGNTSGTKPIDNQMGAAAIGIFFDPVNYDKNLPKETVDAVYAFWKSIDLNNLESDIKLNSLMDVIDLENRWIYKGSRTMPPCGRYVYWSVINRVYPIQPEIMTKLKAQFEVVNASTQTIEKN